MDVWIKLMKELSKCLSSSTVVFKLYSKNHSKSATSIAGIYRCCKILWKIYIIQSAIEPQICISSYLYTPMKIQFKQQPLPEFWLTVASEYPLLSKRQ